jgi:hypothetical protein
MRYRLRESAEVRAEQIEFGKPLPTWVHNTNDGLAIQTLRGWRKVKTDDWIVSGGPSSPFLDSYGPEEFERLYEPA